MRETCSIGFVQVVDAGTLKSGNTTPGLQILLDGTLIFCHTSSVEKCAFTAGDSSRFFYFRHLLIGFRGYVGGTTPVVPATYSLFRLSQFDSHGHLKVAATREAVTTRRIPRPRKPS